jgi:hypothetical protein
MLLQTKKQLESLSLDEKINILNKNADANKKTEPLSPEDKDQFEKKYCCTTQILQVPLS